jgi:hypothetical protein
MVHRVSKQVAHCALFGDGDDVGAGEEIDDAHYGVNGA